MQNCSGSDSQQCIHNQTSRTMSVSGCCTAISANEQESVKAAIIATRTGSACMECDMYKRDAKLMTLQELCQVFQCKRKDRLEELLHFDKTLTNLKKFIFRRQVGLDSSSPGRLLVVLERILTTFLANEGLLRRSSRAGMVVDSYFLTHLIGMDGTNSTVNICGMDRGSYRHSFSNEQVCNYNIEISYQTQREDFIDELNLKSLNEVPSALLGARR